MAGRRRQRLRGRPGRRQRLLHRRPLHLGRHAPCEQPRPHQVRRHARHRFDRRRTTARSTRSPSRAAPSSPAATSRRRAARRTSTSPPSTRGDRRGRRRRSSATRRAPRGATPFVAALRLSGSMLYVGGILHALGDGTRPTSAPSTRRRTRPTTGPRRRTTSSTRSRSRRRGRLRGRGLHGRQRTRPGPSWRRSDLDRHGLGLGSARPTARCTRSTIQGTTVYAGGAFTDIGGAPDRTRRAERLRHRNGDELEPGRQRPGLRDLRPGRRRAGLRRRPLRHREPHERRATTPPAIDPSGTGTVSTSFADGRRRARSTRSLCPGTNIGLGGEFRTAGAGGPTAGPVHRANLAAIDLTTGTATDWNPRANDEVEVVAVSG